MLKFSIWKNLVMRTWLSAKSYWRLFMFVFRSDMLLCELWLGKCGLVACHCSFVFHHNILTFRCCCRKKRKWDQPAESLISAGLAGALPLDNVGLLGGITLPGVTPVSGTHFINPLAASFPTVPQVPLIPQQTAAVIQKLIQVRYLFAWILLYFVKFLHEYWDLL